MVCQLASSPGLSGLRKFFASSKCAERPWIVLQAGRCAMPTSRPHACRSQNGERYVPISLQEPRESWPAEVKKASTSPESFAALEGESCSLRGGGIDLARRRAANRPIFVALARRSDV
jgi:hypothetical protein